MGPGDRYRTWVMDLAGFLRQTGHAQGQPLVVADDSVAGAVGAFETASGRGRAESGYRPGTLRLEGGTRLTCLQPEDDAKDAWALALPARVAAVTQASALVVVRRAGPLVDGLPPVASVRDHLNLSGGNPLVGPNHDDWGVRFPDMSDPYTSALRAVLPDVRGVLFAELSVRADPEERSLAARLGAEAVGHGVAPLAIAAGHAGVPFAAFVVLSDGSTAWPGVSGAMEAISRAVQPR